MAFLLWLLAGVAAVSAAFFMNDSTGDLWPATNAGGLAAGLFIIVLVLSSTRKPIPKKNGLIVLIPAFLGLVSLASAWTGHEIQSRWQRERLLTVRTIIARGVFESDETRFLLGILDSYYSRSPRGKATIREAFLSAVPSATEGADIYIPQWQSDSSRCRLVRSLENDRIEIVAVDKVAPGRESGFQNEMGMSGKVQERFVLTAKGVEHVSDN